ncbi:MAG: hypothetical protein IT379_24500, partial [Deltaproteobacteria bacterium]|nr:hypothetical protein [Deltaproteobacteria bacterium]
MQCRSFAGPWPEKRIVRAPCQRHPLAGTLSVMRDRSRLLGCLLLLAFAASPACGDDDGVITDTGPRDAGDSGAADTRPPPPP